MKIIVGGAFPRATVVKAPLLIYSIIAYRSVRPSECAISNHSIGLKSLVFSTWIPRGRDASISPKRIGLGHGYRIYLTAVRVKERLSPYISGTILEDVRGINTP